MNLVKKLVYLNGVLLQDGGVDYATTSSSVITLHQMEKVVT